MDDISREDLLEKVLTQATWADMFRNPVIPYNAAWYGAFSIINK